MQNHYYDNTHPLHPFTHSLPANPGALPPTNALRGPGELGPEIRPGFWPCEKDGAWQQVQDHRGKEGYLNGQPFTIKDLGPLPHGFSTTPPPPTPEELKERRKQEILTELARLDAESVRPLRAIASGEGTEYDVKKLAELDKKAAELRAELAE